MRRRRTATGFVCWSTGCGRGALQRKKARIDLWLKDLAPSDALRRRVHGDPKQWENFVIEYRHELAREPALSAVANLRDRARNGPVTLLYAARNETRNNAVALRDWLQVAAAK